MSETWWVTWAHRWGAGALVYRRPRSAESGGDRVAIVDVVGLTRFVAVAVLLGAMLRRMTS